MVPLLSALAVGVGGAAGCLSRYGLALLIPPSPSGWPYATLSANILGSLVMGAGAEWIGAKAGFPPTFRLALLTGFCGGLTTLSSLLWESETLLRGSHRLLAVSYFGLSLLLPALALFGGIALSRFLLRT